VSQLVAGRIVVGIVKGRLVSTIASGEARHKLVDGHHDPTVERLSLGGHS
jgi:hypothetical protein